MPLWRLCTRHQTLCRLCLSWSPQANKFMPGHTLILSILPVVINTEERLLICKNGHCCQARLTVSDSNPGPSLIRTSMSPRKSTAPLHSPAESIRVDPDCLLWSSGKASFISLLKEFQVDLDHCISGFNGAAGPNKGVVNMGPVEPLQNKGHYQLNFT